ncbi:MAG: RsmD family RNA methyltransferase [Leptospira sp.]|nr:RsmD family RNA methyltransferase [Leptospira sp.]
MSSSLRVQSGGKKGMPIPIPPEVKGNAQFTPSLLKKSLTGRILSFAESGVLDLNRSLFIDLFAGSGQIGFEAMSLGFAKVAFMELDKKRFSHLLEFSSKEKLDALFYRKDGFRFYNNFDLNFEPESVVYFLDPPYSFWETGTEKIRTLIEQIQASYPSSNLFIFIQAPKKIELVGIESVVFGNNLLYFWNRLRD